MLIIKINALTNFFAVIIGIFYYKWFTKEIKTIFYFVVFGALTQLYMTLHSNFVMKNQMPIGHFYFPIAFLIISIFYIQVLKDFIKPFFLYTILILFETYCVINSLFLQNILEYPSIEGAVGAMIIFLFSVAWFTKVMVEAKITKLANEPLVWINSAFLIYYTGGFFYHSLYNLRINASLEVAILAIKMFSVLNLLFYLIITIGFLKVKKTKPAKVS